MYPHKDDSAALRHPRRTGGASLRALLALGIAAACGPRIIEEDGEPKFRRCLYVSAVGVTADGERRRTDYNRSPTHQLCTCSTYAEAADFSPGGYRYGDINELGFEFCKELVEQAEILDDNCQELYDRDSFALSYGQGPDGIDSEPPLCDEDVAAGCQG